jgi:hypothetical protein
MNAEIYGRSPLLLSRYAESLLWLARYMNGSKTWPESWT